MGVRIRVSSRLDGQSAELEFEQSRVVIGRATSADVPLPHGSVSMTHATLRQQANGYVMVDERSTNGTIARGVKLAADRPRAVRSGDAFQIGPYELTITYGVPTTRSMGSDERTEFTRVLSHTASSRRLLVRNGTRVGEELALPDTGRLVLGRGETVDVAFDDADLSREHAAVELSPTTARIVDLGSKNGLEVQGRPVESRLLRDGDRIVIGATELRYEDARDARVRAIACVAEDAPMPDLPEPPEPEPEPTTDGAARPIEAEAVIDEHEPPSPTPAPGRGALGREDLADRVVLALALAVIAASVGAAYWLFQG